MDLSWKDVVRLYAPYIVYGLFIALGAIYSLGYRQGMSALLDASGRAGGEAKCGR